MLRSFVALDVLQHLFVGLLHETEAELPVGVALLDCLLSVLSLSKQPCLNEGVLRLLALQVVLNASLGVDSPVFESVDAHLLRLLEEAHERWLQPHCLEEVDLSLGLREAVKDPAVDLAVALLESLLHDLHANCVGHRLALV